MKIDPLGLAPRRGIDVSDLLEVPYAAGGVHESTGLDCLGVALAVHRRLGLFQPHFPLDWATAQNWILGPGWTELGRDVAALRELGDVVLVEGGELAPLGVACVFNLGRHGSAPAEPWLITSTPERGARAVRASAFLRSVGGHARVRGCYRWRPVHSGRSN